MPVHMSHCHSLPLALPLVTGSASGREADPNHACNARMDFGGTGRISTENSCSAPYLVVFSCRQQLYPRSCHAALPTPPWRRPRLENAQCPACRDRCLPHHHPRRAARAEPPRCATRRAARALPPRQPPPSRAAQPPHVRGGKACNLKKTPPSDFFATFK